MTENFTLAFECVGKSEVADYISVLVEHEVSFKVVWTDCLYSIYVEESVDIDNMLSWF